MILPKKRKELSQMMALPGGSIRMEKGFRRCDFCQNVEKENAGLEKV
jgi:hypothetical protein